MYKLILSTIGASILLPVSAAASCGAGQACLSWTEAAPSPAAYQAPQPYYTAPAYTAPRSSQIAGLGPDESLCPATCPVNVDVPKGGKVIDCYKICKTMKAVPQTQYRIVRVVRPIVYVQRPAVYNPPHGCRTACKTSRYGY